jgi:hypothetical protein
MQQQLEAANWSVERETAVFTARHGSTLRTGNEYVQRMRVERVLFITVYTVYEYPHSLDIQPYTYT